MARRDEDRSASATVIRTPDQRLRVFVSSTLGELAPERSAVRDAIDGVHLTPVMFELGARPHPPQELYRAYLDQSHVFLGIYWERYGWTAPGAERSGLEDEYRLAGDRPRLLYIKHPAPSREPRLADLIADFQADDRRVVQVVLDARGARRACRGRPGAAAVRAVRGGGFASWARVEAVERRPRAAHRDRRAGRRDRSSGGGDPERAATGDAHRSRRHRQNATGDRGGPPSRRRLPRWPVVRPARRRHRLPPRAPRHGRPPRRARRVVDPRGGIGRASARSPRPAPARQPGADRRHRPHTGRRARAGGRRRRSGHEPPRADGCAESWSNRSRRSRCRSGDRT